MICVVFKVPTDIIGSQYEKLIIQKLNVTLDIISDYHGHTSIPAHRISHCRQQDQAKVRIADGSEQILREQQKLLAVIHAYAQRPLLFRYQIQQTVTLTAEKPQMNGGKPADRTYLEKDLPASLDKALREYIQGEKDKVSYMDCLWGELYSAINSNQWSNAITQEQADYLRAKYL